jgi:hypothetical protein
MLTKQCLFALSQLHSELAGKLAGNLRETKRPRLEIFQVEAVMKLLSPVNIRLIAPKRRNVGNPWFKRGTLARAVIDTLRRSPEAMTTREIADALLAGKKKPEATRHQAMVLQAAILAALRARNGKVVVGDGPRGKWRLAGGS